MPNKQNISFFSRVYDVVRLVPAGRVTTYGHIAEFLGQKGSARMVGWAMNSSHNISPPVPAHRVINRKGLLTGKNHFMTPDLMQKFLENEGIRIIDDQVIDFNKLVWIPLKELRK